MFGSEKIHAFLASMRAKNRSPRTVAAYGEYLSALGRFGFSRGVSLVDMQEDHLEGWIRNMTEAKMAENTIYTRVMAARSFFKWMYERDLVSRDPSKTIRFQRSVRLPVPPDISAVRAMIESCTPGTWHGARDKAVLLVLYGTGCRISELCRMNADSIRGNEFRVMGKGSKERFCLLPDQAVEAVEAWRIHHRSEVVVKTDALFVTEIGSRLMPNIIRKMMHRRRAALGCNTKSIYPSGQTRSHLTPHSIRHLFATELMENGAQIRAIQELLGHSSIVTTQLYTHVTMDARRRAHALLPRI